MSACFATSLAHAHFKLLKPLSWVKEDNAGGPQKGFPCGPGGSDNVNPTPTSGTVTEFHAGDTIEVQWVDTIAHPGHFRIALAENRSDFKMPTITQDASCNYDEKMVPTTAEGNVLADGVSFRSRTGFSAAAGTMFSQKVTLPNKPCDKCTLQVMQIMENDIKAISNCYYNHCADIKILPAVSGESAGTNGAGASGAAGASTAGSGGSTASAETGGQSAAAGGSAAAGTGVAAGTVTMSTAGTSSTASTGTSGATGSTTSSQTAAGTGATSTGTTSSPSGTTSASAGRGATSTPAASKKSGCNVAQIGGTHFEGVALLGLLGWVVVVGRRFASKRRRFARTAH
jgi:hypothetical protein